MFASVTMEGDVIVIFIRVHYMHVNDLEVICFLILLWSTTLAVNFKAVMERNKYTFDVLMNVSFKRVLLFFLLHYFYFKHMYLLLFRLFFAS